MKVNKHKIFRNNLCRDYIENENKFRAIDEMLEYYDDIGMIKQLRIGLPASGHLRLPIVNGINYNVDYILNKIAKTGHNRLKISDTIFAGGKGLQLHKCLAAALGETFERIFGSFIFFERFEKHLSGSYKELSKEYNLLSPKDFRLFTEKENIDNRHMCEKFDEMSKLIWVELKNPNNNSSSMWVPAQLIYLLYVGKQSESQIGYSSSGGLSCHNTTYDAQIHGIYEVIERDAINICWNCKIPPKIINFNKEVQSNELKSLFGKYYYLLDDIKVYLHDVTNEAYVVTAIKKDSNIKKYYYLSGGGVSINIDKAIEGAITEFIQAENNLKNLIFTPNWHAAHSINYLFNVPEDVDYRDLKLFYQIVPYYGIDKNFKKLHWYLHDGEVIKYSEINKLTKLNEGFPDGFWYIDFTPDQLDSVKIIKCFNPSLTPAYMSSIPMKGHKRYKHYAPEDKMVDDPIPFP